MTPFSNTAVFQYRRFPIPLRGEVRGWHLTVCLFPWIPVPCTLDWFCMVCRSLTYCDLSGCHSGDILIGLLIPLPFTWVSILWNSELEQKHKPYKVNDHWSNSLCKPIIDQFLGTKVMSILWSKNHLCLCVCTMCMYYVCVYYVCVCTMGTMCVYVLCVCVCVCVCEVLFLTSINAL